MKWSNNYCQHKNEFPKYKIMVNNHPRKIAPIHTVFPQMYAPPTDTLACLPSVFCKIAQYSTFLSQELCV